jgi:peptidoglycan/xylan/chitin deacetylase (PgdA/CDA1 family)
LHLSAARFREQLEFLTANFEIVPLDELPNGAHTGDRPLAAITIDDAYMGAVTAGVQHLAELQVPATIFVPPGLLGGRSFWWDSLEIDLDGEARSRGLDEYGGEQHRIEAWAAAHQIPTRSVPAYARSASVEALQQALTLHPGLAIGSHTWSHPNLTTVSDAELRRELISPLAWLRDHFPGRTIAWLAYPYGAAGPRERAAAQAAAYAGACRVTGGWVTSERFDPWWTPRLNIPAGLSTRGFALRMAGFLCR